MNLFYKFILLLYGKFYSGAFKKREVYRFLAKIFSFFFMRKKTHFDIKVKTYDGSNQVVHPDMLFNPNTKNYILAFTPYPYGFDCYENPSILYGKELNNLKAVKSNPIAISEIDRPLCHLCDPVLLQDGQKYYCFFLDVLNIGDTRKCVFYYSDSNDILKWSSKKIVKQYSFNISSKQHVLCPAIIKYGTFFYFYTVHVDVENDSYLSVSKSGLIDKFENEEQCIIKNMPENYYLWHLNICFDKDYFKNHSISESKNILGLFLLRKRGDTTIYKTVFAVSDDFKNWNITGELFFPEELKNEALSLYKGTIIPNSGDILISYKDKKRMWRLARIPYKEIVMEK